MTRRLLAAAILATCLGPASAWAWDAKNFETSAGITLEYVLVQPENFDPGRPWPVLLAFPGGRQDGSAVLGGLREYWGEAAASRGWVVVAPIAPDGLAFHEGSESLIPELLDEVASLLPLEGGRFHVAGVASGGLAAFRVAIESPERFASLVVLPGGPANASDVARLDRLTGLRVRMFAGSDNEEYLRLMQGTAKQLARLGVDVQAATLEGEGVPPKSVDGAALFEVLEGIRHELAASPESAGMPAHSTPEGLLDGLLAAGARGNGRLFFEAFSEEAVVFWQDPSTRWSRQELEEVLGPRFGAGERLRFALTERHVEALPGGMAATFDERLLSFELGLCRSQGVLVLKDEEWRIHRYALSCKLEPVPEPPLDEP